jgi:hypothetical protein
MATVGNTNMTPPTPPPVQQRVIAEQEELFQKVIRLGGFLESDTYSSLPANEQFRLRIQHTVMCAYSDILLERIKNF